MSTCDTCSDPGHCCRRLHLTISEDWQEWIETPLHALVAMAIMWLPFVPHSRTVVDHHIWWSCPLLIDGRCSDYANRPRLCHDYQPYEDTLCAEFIGPRHAEAERSPFTAGAL